MMTGFHPGVIVQSSALHRGGGPALPTDTGSPTLSALVDALGMAWSTFTLYEDPRTVEAFQRAVETLHAAPEHPWRIEAGVDGFSQHGEPIPSQREGSLRVAHRLFALGTAAVEFRAPASGDDLIRLFLLLDPADPPADAGAALADSGAEALRLLDREMLHAGVDERELDPATATGRHIVEADGPVAFVLSMLEDGGVDPASVARRFVEEYERTFLLIDADDPWGIEEVVRSFVDGFWHLPEAHRAQIFSLMLERSHRPENTSFLDQFGGLELAEMNRSFGAEGHPLLEEYLRVATEEGGRHQDDLGEIVSGPSNGPLLTERMVDQVASVLRRSRDQGGRPSEEALARIAGILPDPAAARRSVCNALKALFTLAATPEEAAGAATVWSERVAMSVASGDMAEADERINLVAGLDLDHSLRNTLVEALSAAMTGDAVTNLARLITSPTPDGPGASVRRAAPLFAADGLIRELGDENKAGRRKLLLGALQLIARSRPGLVLPHLDDQRWFVVRNVLASLGSTPHPDLAGRIASLTEHADHRVRVEALRALHRVGGEGAADTLMARLGDPHDAVRAEAARVLGRFDGTRVEAKLLDLVRAGEVLQAETAVAALARMTLPAAVQTVRRLARNPFPIRNRARRLRAAARRALGGTNE